MLVYVKIKKIIVIKYCNLIKRLIKLSKIFSDRISYFCSIRVMFCEYLPHMSPNCFQLSRYVEADRIGGGGEEGSELVDVQICSNKHG